MKQATLSKWILPFMLALAGCTESERTDDATGEQLATHQITRLPKEGVTSTLVDFGGKIHLVGYAVEPTTVHPGAQVKVRLYFRSLAPLDKGVHLITYLLEGRRAHAFESGGPLRGSELGPSAWRAGKLYVDEHTIDVPADAKAKELALAVAIGTKLEGTPEGESAEGVTSPSFRLPILSGAADGAQRAILTYLRNDVAAKPAARQRRVPAEARRRALQPAPAPQ